MKCFEWAEVRRKCQEETSLEGKEIKNTIVITFSFLVVFTAFNALQNLHSSLHDEESLGLVCLSIIYFTAIISSIFSPTIIGLVGAKTVLVAFFLAHSVYVLANFYPSFATMVPAAVALGAFNGPAWTAQALYISANAYSFSKSSSASPYTILSRFNGFFFAMFATTQIVGNLVTSTVIRDGVGNKSDELVVFKYCGIDDCPYNENVTEIEDPEDWVIDITLGFFMACALFGLVLVFFLLTPLPRSEWIEKVTVRNTVTSCFSVLLTTDMLLLVPFILFTSVEHAFLMASFTKAYVTCAIGIHMVGYVMAAYGATTPIFVFLFTRLSKITGRFLLLTLSMATHIVLLVILYHWSPDGDDEAIIFIVPMVWGVAESILQAQANSLITMLYPSQKEPAFANFHAWRSIGYCITFVNATYLCISTKLILCMICASLGLVLYIFVELKTRMREKLILEGRGSIVSIPQYVVPKDDTVSTTSTKRTSVSSFMSIHDRLSFDHIELADVIKEAQNGWRRDETGLTLEVTRVMSSPYLRDSKATKMFHTCPPDADAAWPGDDGRSQGRPRVLPRSLSDGHVSYNSYRHGSMVNRSRPARSVSTSGVSEKRRAVSEIVPPNFDIIPEDLYEDEEEFVMQREKDFEADDSVFLSVPEYDETDGPPPGFDKHNFFRRLSATLQTINLDSGSRRGSNFEITIDTPEPDSATGTGRVNLGFELEEESKTEEGGRSNARVSFSFETIGVTGSPAVHYTPSPGKIQRPFSVDQVHMHELNERRNKLGRIRKNKSFNVPSAVTDSVVSGTSAAAHRHRHHRSKTPSSENGVIKSNFKVFGLKGLHKLTKRKRKSTVSLPSPPTDHQQDGAADGAADGEGQVSDADSDGFVPEDVVEGETPVVADAVRNGTAKKLSRIPVMESEDVSCIY